ncbi:hypothetical protein NHF46_03520 [Arthrobacter alpinus]|nr:hypothetical protein [Arthrobacter alpinus]
MYTKLVNRIQGLMGLFWREVAKFGVVGGVAFIIDTGIYLWLLSGSMAGHPTKAKIISAAVATVFPGSPTVTGPSATAARPTCSARSSCSWS